MKRLLGFISAVILVVMLPLSVCAAEYLIPVGKVIGLQLRNDAVTVVAFDDALGKGAKEAGLQIGDELYKIDDQSIKNAEQIPDLLRGKSQAKLTVRRGSKDVELTIPLRTDKDGTRMGVYLRQGVAGIGTVTWYDPQTGMFGALGHGVSDSRGMLLNMTEGMVFDAMVQSVRTGKKGKPGQIRGAAKGLQESGVLHRNTPQGVFGTAKEGWEGSLLPVADYDEVRVGKASIFCTVTGETPKEYSVEIQKIYPEDRPDCRNFLLCITDPELLQLTGGIVQGMSGSPIIQDGKLVGAVTHVLVNDPTRGYGIFIENMLTAAS